MFAGIVVFLQVVAAPTDADATSVDCFCQRHPDRVQRLFEALNLDGKGLEATKAAAAARDWPEACRALLAYYRSSAWSTKLRVAHKAPSPVRDPAGDAILGDVYTLYEVPAKVPRRPDGGLDWTYNGPSGDKEWGWGLNRQPWVMTLLNAYTATGNAAYLTTLDGLIRDWVASNPYPGVKSSTPQWRGLEVYMRVARNWPRAFYGLQEYPEFSPAARLLMLSSIPDHAHYNRHFHSGGGNWITMEMIGLASAAVYWPEFKEANAWFEYAAMRLTPELTKQVYPDGAQKELTSTYHRAAMRSFSDLANLAREAGRPLPEAFGSCVERMTNYVAYTMNPAGRCPLINDSDQDLVAPEVLERAEALKRPDWKYIATNGAQGTKPEGLPTSIFPWAGQAIMRSGWDANALWAFFDAGPLGTGHWHLDKLHLSVAAYGRDILVDGGRYTYQAGPWRAYFVGSQSHNVLLVDGHSQKPWEAEASKPMEGNYAVTPDYDFCRGTFDGGYEGVDDTVTHERSVLAVRGAYWLVLDRLTAHAPHEVTALWHFHPSCRAAVDGQAVASVDKDAGNVRVTPSPGTDWKLETVKGQESPTLQGWWSPKYNIKEASTCAVYRTRIAGPTAFAWLIVPAMGQVPQGSVSIESLDESTAKIRVELTGTPGRAWRIPLRPGDVKVE